MKNLLLVAFITSSVSIYAQFDNSHVQWNITDFETTANGTNGLQYIAGSSHGLMDMNGDGLLDFVDAANTSGGVWTVGSQHYWKVYVNTGSGFSTTAVDWNIPDFETTSNGTNGLQYLSGASHGLYDIDGDGKLDLVDAANTSGGVWTVGSQHYWTVYYNTGSGFSTTATQWNIPGFETTSNGTNGLQYISGASHSLYDIDGDGKLDLVDAANTSGGVWTVGSQHFWKVYLNSGSGFSTTGSQWNIPDFETTSNGTNGLQYMAGASHGMYDIDGDGKLDLIDAANTTGGVWTVGSQHYWKVYYNTGSGFSTTGAQWNIPDFETTSNGTNGLQYIAGSSHGLYDMNGDSKLDFVDAANTSGGVWTVGSQHYWKVYSNSGSGFSTAGTQWDIPDFETTSNGTNGLQYIFGVTHGLYDMNGDSKLDLVDAANTSGGVWTVGSQHYWKVYYVENLGVSKYELSEIGMSVYPNPAQSKLSIHIKNYETLSSPIINIYNFVGELVYTSPFKPNSLIEIDVNILPNGVYIVELSDNDRSFRQKIVKY